MASPMQMTSSMITTPLCSMKYMNNEQNDNSDVIAECSKLVHDFLERHDCKLAASAFIKEWSNRPISKEVMFVHSIEDLIVKRNDRLIRINDRSLQNAAIESTKTSIQDSSSKGSGVVVADQLSQTSSTTPYIRKTSNVKWVTVTGDDIQSYCTPSLQRRGRGRPRKRPLSPSTSHSDRSSQSPRADSDVTAIRGDISYSAPSLQHHGRERPRKCTLTLSTPSSDGSSQSSGANSLKLATTNDAKEACIISRTSKNSDDGTSIASTVDTNNAVSLNGSSVGLVPGRARKNKNPQRLLSNTTIDTCICSFDSCNTNVTHGHDCVLQQLLHDSWLPERLAETANIVLSSGSLPPASRDDPVFETLLDDIFKQASPMKCVSNNILKGRENSCTSLPMDKTKRRIVFQDDMDSVIATKKNYVSSPTANLSTQDENFLDFLHTNY